MTTLVPRPPYSKDEVQRLYPAGLQLRLVQVLLRHGERSPVSARFRNAGLAARKQTFLGYLHLNPDLTFQDWPYCNAAKQLSSIVMSNTDLSTWDSLKWRREMETFGEDDSPTIARGPKGEIDGVCQLGELTDTGRASTLALGQRLRHLYVDQLGFMPKTIPDTDMFYLRATPIPRAIESLQQAFWGFYPSNARTASFPPPTITTRTAADETLFPNDINCQRFSQLSRAFAQRTADRWNESNEMEYLNKLLSNWMPEKSPKVAVDSHPRLSGIMDTINSTLAHGPATRLPREFYDSKGRDIIEAIGVEEWFSGYNESREYRQVGIGSLVGELVSRMVGSVEHRGSDGLLELGRGTGTLGTRRGGEKLVKFALSGCHDTTLAAVLCSFGAFEGTKWPPYTSHIALELFQKIDAVEAADTPKTLQDQNDSKALREREVQGQKQNLWSSIFGQSKEELQPGLVGLQAFSRKSLDDLTPEERKRLDGFYVRIRYNDKPMTVPGCLIPGNHLEGDGTFCTLEAFKRIADKFTPKSWKHACKSNIGSPAFPEEGAEKSGY